MKTSFSISVKKPCSENFEHFSTTAKGGFCGTCKKEVIDFTAMPEKELIEHFDKSAGETCGRFYTSQLKSYQTNPLTKMNGTFLSRSIALMGFSLLALCSIPELQAQEIASLNPSKQTEIVIAQRLHKATAIAFEKYTVTGTVLDEENLPLAGVNVVLKGTAEGVMTDFDGKFEFPRALEVDETLVFSHIGYEAKEYTVVAGNSKVIDITIAFKSSDIFLMGDVVIGGTYKTKRNIFQKFVGLFK